LSITSQQNIFDVLPTFAARISVLAMAMSPWWFCPTSAIMKHGCEPPTHLPGANSISFDIGDNRMVLNVLTVI